MKQPMKQQKTLCLKHIHFRHSSTESLIEAKENQGQQMAKSTKRSAKLPVSYLCY
jgi:hypothetical protein